MSRFIGYCYRCIYRLMCYVVIAFAVVLLVLNLCTQLIVFQDDRFEEWLTGHFGVSVLAEIERSRWLGVLPEFSIAEVEIGEGRSSVKVSQVRARPDIFRSLASQSLSWRELHMRGVSVSLVEVDGGRWQIAGIDLVSDQKGNQATAIERMLLGSRHISIEDIDVRMVFSSGTEITVQMDSARIDNHLGYHRMVAHTEVDQESNQLDFILELTGVSNRFSELEGHGYVGFQGRNLTEAFTALIERYGSSTHELHTPPKVTGEIWSNIRVGSEAEFQGYIEVENIPGQAVASELHDLYFRTDLAGEYAYFDDELRVDFVQPDFISAEHRWPLSDFRITRRPGDYASRYSLQVQELDLTSLGSRLHMLYELPEAIGNVLLALNPSGFIDDLSVVVDSGQPLETVRLAAQLREVSLDNFRNAPAVRNLNGELKTSATDGVMSFAGQDLGTYYPGLYDWWLNFDDVSGEVAWNIDYESKRFLVSGKELVAQSSMGTARGDFLVDSSLVRDKEGMDFHLFLGMVDSEAQYWPLLMPVRTSNTLREWLAASGIQAQLPRGAFVYRGKVRRGSGVRRTMQLRLAAEDGNLSFSSSWPRVNGVDAELFVSNAEFRGRTSQAKLASLDIQGGRIHVDGTQRPAQMEVALNASGATDAMLDLVRETGLRRRVGSSLDSLDFEGDSKASLSLLMPLLKQPTMESIDIDLGLELDSNELTIAERRISLQAMEGNVVYDNEGLSSSDLTAMLWGKPIDLSVFEEREEQRLNIKAKAEVAVSSVASWLDSEWLTRLTGRTGVDALFQFNTDRESGQPHRYFFRSDTVGVESALPGRLFKAPNEEAVLSLVIERGKEEVIDLSWAKGLMLNLRKPGDGVLAPRVYRSGVIGLNAEPPEHVEGKLLGRLFEDELDVSAWLAQLTSGTSKKSTTAKALPQKMFGLSPELDLSTNRLLVGSENGGTDFGVFQARLVSEQDGWRVGFENAFAKGAYFQPAEQQSFPQLNLEYVDLDYFRRLQARDASAGAEELGIVDLRNKDKVTTLTDTSVDGAYLEPYLDLTEEKPPFDPRQIPSMDFSIDELRFSGAGKGSWSAQLRSSNAGVNIDNIHWSYRSLSCGIEDEGIALFWGVDEEGQYSALNLTLGFEDISDVFSLGGVTSPMTSKSGQVYASINWSGAPQQLKQAPAYGVMGVEAEKGEFHAQASGVGAGLVRLIGLVNVNTWLRRLRLDFSDVAATGTPYDKMQGDFTLNDNFISTLTPVNVDLPAGRMLLDGDVDLNEGNVDAQLVVTLPARQNLTWIAALAAGLPAAAGVWVVGQIFDEEMDSLSSVNYQVSGPLDEPKVSTKRVFNSTMQ